MKTNRNDQAPDSRLRVLFSGTVETLALSADATLEDLARKLGKFPRRRYGDPVGICVTLGRESDTTLFH